MDDAQTPGRPDVRYRPLVVRASRRLGVLVSGFWFLVFNAQAQDSGWRLQWNPPDLYHRYVADPRRPRNTAALMYAVESDIPNSGDFRFLVAIGDQHNIVRLYRPDAPDHPWQLELEARYYAHFDIETNLDELGHDARLGTMITHTFSPRLAARVMFFHTSSHMGDEYILRNKVTEEERVSSRKEEIAFGASYRLGDRWHTYGELGYGINLGVLNKQLRLQTGLEYEEEISAPLRWYSAVNLTTWQENDWELSVALQTGLLVRFPASNRQYRLALDLYDGRSQLDAFFQFRESYVTLGFWLDL